MKTGLVNLIPRLFIARLTTLAASMARSIPGLTALPLAALLLVAVAGCFTPVPRSGQATPTPPTTVASPTSTSEPTPTFTPLPSPTATAAPVPTPTVAVATPAPRPTATPEPTRPAATPTATPTPPPPPTTDPADGLVLQVYAPEDGATVPGNSVAVYGQTTPGARVVVSGVAATVDAQGGFRTVVPLEPALNVVVVEASNGGDEVRRISRQVTSLALPVPAADYRTGE